MSERRMFEVKCSECGKTAMIPFKPTGDRPVYCKPCLAKRRGEKRKESNAGSIFNMKNAWASRRNIKQTSEEDSNAFQTY